MAASVKEVKETPLMKQYNSIKAKYPDAILLFRVGDFYETFGQDAIKTAATLGIVLTKRANGSATHIELAGFPHHSMDSYLPKLVRAGYKVAVCDQLEDPKFTKTIVKRGVTELVTPGLTLNDKILDQKTNNFLASIVLDGDRAGLSLLDISTGEFFLAENNIEQIDKIVKSLKPNELLFEKSIKQQVMDRFGSKIYYSPIDDWAFTYDYGTETLTKHFSTTSLKGFGVESLKLAIASAGAVLHYLSTAQHDHLKHISTLSRLETEDFVWMDAFTIRNLELFGSQYEGGKGLLQIIDRTAAAPGARLLRRWLALPLKDEKAINERHQIVDYFFNHLDLAESIHQYLNDIGDIERLNSKAATGKINPREVSHILKGLQYLEPIKNHLTHSNEPLLQQMGQSIDLCIHLKDKIEKELESEAPVNINKGKVIKAGVNEELDELRHISHSGKDYLLQVQQRESEATGIPSLKVAYNNVFGYYLEVTHTHKDKVPSTWIRKQTLTNAERYITPELKIYEEKILGAEEKILSLETQIYQALVQSISDYILPIQANAKILAQLDCLISFALSAKAYDYIKPNVNSSYTLNIKNARHPVIEQLLPATEKYVDNDIYLDNEQQQILMITGPNMSGKSAILRQTALIVIMAQIGSFVPASSADIGIIDKVFTRVGASDNISSGESTFMVEMNETSSILNNLSDRSLILLDEIGRGTSTYDGISIAWAIAEFIHEQAKARAKTLFATHYHELNDMHMQFMRIKNFNVAVKEINQKIIFLRKLVEGGSEHSFGIHVAKMAGMPQRVIQRAEDMLLQLEAMHEQTEGHAVKVKHKTQNNDGEMQLSFFQLDDPILQQIKKEIVNTDINTLTPVEALLKLSEIKKILLGK
jgi:DNA mismatch repair protein MutS